MARRHRAADGGNAAGSGRGSAGALSRRRRRAQSSAAGSTIYPGSPALARALAAPAGPADRLRARTEGRRRARRAICAAMRASRPCDIDGWTALAAYVPPKERRGLVLIDPPFEEDGDFRRLPQRLGRGAPQMGDRHLHCSGIRSRAAASRTLSPSACAGSASPKILRAELIVAPLSDPSRLNGCGLILVNPPWTLESELSVLLPALAGIARPRRHRPASGSIGSPATPAVDAAARWSPFHRAPSWCLVPSLAVTFRLRWGAGGVTEAG